MADTIFALSSGPPPSAIAVVRVSGPGAFAAVATLAGTLPEPRRASLRRLRDPAGDIVDRALVLIFPGPDSATGEDLAELHLHGGRAVVRRVESLLGKLSGVRGAEPGEFTRRALEAGRIDLTEAEGLADLLAAETEGQRRAALHAAEGVLRRRIEDWTDRVLVLSAAIEIAIDHSDEPDAADEAAIVARVQAGAREMADEIAVLIDQPPAERLRDGIRVVLAGPPNSGKSTLFNRLVGREAAIVSPIAGTTRDRIEAPVMRDGVAWLFTDTAGLADTTDDPIEALGISRARESAAIADIVLWLGDDVPPAGDARIIALHSRADEAGRDVTPTARLAVSAMTGVGETRLWSELIANAAAMLPKPDMVTLNDRQRALCCDAHISLCNAASTRDDLLIAEHLRLVRVAFDRITGRAHTEAMLDTLFAQFCIGK